MVRIAQDSRIWHPRSERQAADLGVIRAVGYMDSFFVSGVVLK